MKQVGNLWTELHTQWLCVNEASIQTNFQHVHMSTTIDLGIQVDLQDCKQVRISAFKFLQSGVTSTVWNYNINRNFSGISGEEIQAYKQVCDQGITARNTPWSDYCKKYPLNRYWKNC